MHQLHVECFNNKIRIDTNYNGFNIRTYQLGRFAAFAVLPMKLLQAYGSDEYSVGMGALKKLRRYRLRSSLHHARAISDRRAPPVSVDLDTTIVVRGHEKCSRVLQI